METTSPESVVVDVTPDEAESAESLSPRRASYNPATGALLGHVPVVGRDGIDAALRAAREAQVEWAERTTWERAEVLNQFRATLVREMDAVAKLISMEQGKPVVEAMSIEILSVLAHLRWLTEEGVDLLEGRKASHYHPLFTAKDARFVLEPLGVVAIISPGNYPFSIPAIQILTALLTGNAVVVKPSPFVPLVGQKIAELLRQTSLPTGLFNVIHVEDSDAPYLTSHPSVNKIIFTGSVETGRKVMESAARVPTPVVLELGGKDAAIVARDADLKRTVPGIVWYAFANAGQTCAGVELVFVHAGVYDRFVSEVVAQVESLRVDEGLQSDSEVGPLSTERQLEVVEAHVEDARERGARVLTGGHRLSRPGYFYAPTILADVTPDMRIVQEETFGPVLPIIKVDSLEEAVTVANNTGYGLTASIWTTNRQLGITLANRIQAGAVNVNDHAYHYGEPAAGWGGVAQSGFGRTLGELGLMEMVSPKWISTDMRRGALEPWWYPYDEKTAHLLRNTARLLYGSPVTRVWALLSVLLNPRTWQRVNLARFTMAFRKWL